MSQTDFSHIAVRSENDKAERLFRASVSAYCALSHPSREATAQLDDLALPLFDRVSLEARRFASAALSECKRAPAGLVRRLASEEIHIAAPVLMRSPALSETDLISIATSNGPAHARAISMRQGLTAPVREAIDKSGYAQPQPIATVHTLPETHHRPGSAAEAARKKLRAMMAANAEPTLADEAGSVELPTARPDSVAAFARLLEAALTGSRPRLRTALSDVLEIGFGETAALVRPSERARLMVALSGIDLLPEQAFLILSLVAPGVYRDEKDIRDFVETYRAIGQERGREEIRNLRADTISAIVRPARKGLAPVEPVRILKAS